MEWYKQLNTWIMAMIATIVTMLNVWAYQAIEIYACEHNIEINTVSVALGMAALGTMIFILAVGLAPHVARQYKQLQAPTPKYTALAYLVGIILHIGALLYFLHASCSMVYDTFGSGSLEGWYVRTGAILVTTISIYEAWSWIAPDIKGRLKSLR